MIRLKNKIKSMSNKSTFYSHANMYTYKVKIYIFMEVANKLFFFSCPGGGGRGVKAGPLSKKNFF